MTYDSSVFIPHKTRLCFASILSKHVKYSALFQFHFHLNSFNTFLFDVSVLMFWKVRVKLKPFLFPSFKRYLHKLKFRRHNISTTKRKRINSDYRKQSILFIMIIIHVDNQLVGLWPKIKTAKQYTTKRFPYISINYRINYIWILHFCLVHLFDRLEYYRIFCHRIRCTRVDFPHILH